MSGRTKEDDVLPIADIASTFTFRQITTKQWAYWKRQMRETPQWFVVEKLVWGEDRWRAIAGPFGDNRDAQTVIKKLAARDAQRGASKVYRRRVTSLTETIRMYRNNVNLLADDLHESITDLEISLAL